MNSVRPLYPAGTHFIWPIDAFIEHPVQQRKTAAKALRMLLGLDKEARRQSSKPPVFLLLNASIGLQEVLMAAFPGRVLNPTNFQGTNLIEQIGGDEVAKLFAKTADTVVAFGDLPQPLTNLFDSIKKQGTIHRVKPAPLNKREQSMGLSQSEQPYGQYNSYKEALRPRHYAPTKGVQIREIVDYRPKYHI